MPWPGQVATEYIETSGAPTTPGWSKSYVFLGNRLLSTATPNGTSAETVQYHHPDRLGTRLISNAADTNVVEQATLPFGTALANESTGASNRRFTSYDRSTVTGLDYAVNRHFFPFLPKKQNSRRCRWNFERLAVVASLNPLGSSRAVSGFGSVR